MGAKSGCHLASGLQGGVTARRNSIIELYMYIHISIFVSLFVQLLFLPLQPCWICLRTSGWVAFEDADVENDTHRMELRGEGDLNGEDPRLLRPGVDTQASNLAPRTSISPRTRTTFINN